MDSLGSEKQREWAAVKGMPLESPGFRCHSGKIEVDGRSLTHQTVMVRGTMTGQGESHSAHLPQGSLSVCYSCRSPCHLGSSSKTTIFWCLG